MTKDDMTQDEIDAILKSAANTASAVGSPTESGVRRDSQSTNSEVRRDSQSTKSAEPPDSENTGSAHERGEEAATDQDLPSSKAEEQVDTPETAPAESASEVRRDSQSTNSDVRRDSQSTKRRKSNIDVLLDVPLDVSVELGRAKMPVREMLQLIPGSVIELDRLIGEPVDLLANDRLIARGEVVVFDENFGIRITDIIKPEDRIRSLR